MPGWHEATRQLQEDGAIKMVGLVQEQHGDRAELFMQWKQMTWPVLVDAFNELQVTVVPITLFIDEFGIVREMPRARSLDARREAAQAFVNASFDAPTDQDREIPNMVDPAKDALEQLKWGEDHEIDSAVSSLDHFIEQNPKNAQVRFQRGVVARMKFDSGNERAGSFQKAVTCWKEALELNPNQYIWRRRIQQYGPRLDKPYPFYDWVPVAQNEIRARGKKPVQLSCEPSGAELAKPSRTIVDDESFVENPDRDGKVTTDATFIEIQTVTVPHTSKKQKQMSWRVHVFLDPINETQAHWNNESEPLLIWLDVPSEVRCSKRFFVVANADKATSVERRQIEFEVQLDASVGDELFIRGSAYYNVCEGHEGTCLYRRQEFLVSLDAQ